MKWPRDNQAELIAFYGNPGSSGPGGVSAQLVRVTPPFQMYYDGTPLKSLSFHRKAAPALLAALTEIWNHYGCNQAAIDKLGISKCAGTYNPRKVRGSATKWSNHAFGAAIDLNAEQNGFNVAGNIPIPVIAAFKRQGFRWGGDYHTRKDPMHFEACDGGEVASAMPVGMIDMPQTDSCSCDESDTADAPETTELPAADMAAIGDIDLPDAPAAVAVPAASGSDKVVTTLRTLAGTGLGTAVVGKTIEAVSTEPASDVASQITTVADKSGNIIAATQQVVSVARPGFLNGLIHVVTSPGFLVCVIIAMGAAWAFVWFWQRHHAKATQ